MENVNHAPPPCWYIEYRDHGRITLRQDEADRALATGAIRVTAYGQAIAQQPISKMEITQAIDQANVFKIHIDTANAIIAREGYTAMLEAAKEIK